jgi:Zn-dependent protease with chaperone function
MAGGASLSGRMLVCPDCGHPLPPVIERAVPIVELRCDGCGVSLRVRRRSSRPDAIQTRQSAPPKTTVGGIDLVARSIALSAVRGVYHFGVNGGSILLLAAGGFVPVLGAWLRDELTGWNDVIETLGGVIVSSKSSDPDADLGPAITRTDAPRLFEEVVNISRTLGASPPQQIRLTYLPCCGVVAWKNSRALLIGLPLLSVLTLAELRAVLAHELAHLARGDATEMAKSTRFVEGLGRSLDLAKRPSISPLRLWSIGCRRLSDRLIAPIARGQEARADRAAGSIAGGTVAASALVKVAQVQPLFREVLELDDPAATAKPNLYAFFREFWDRIPESLHTAIRHKLLANVAESADGVHPPLLDRVAIVQTYVDRLPAPDDHQPAASVLGDLEALEQMLHNRLFTVNPVEPSVFHRAGS